MTRWMTCALLLLGGSCIALAQDAPSLRDKVYGTWGVDLDARDLSVRPGDDFDAYASGTWNRNTPIPPDSSFAGPSQDLRRLSEARLRAIIEASPASAPVGALFRSYMDTAGIEARGTAPLEQALAPIDQAATHDALALLLARPALGASPLEISIGHDPDDAQLNVVGVWQAGLRLPDRDFYLLERFAPQRAAYLSHLQRLSTLMGDAEPAGSAERAMAFETAIAKVSYSRKDSRDPAKSLNPQTVALLASQAPGYPFAAVLGELGLPHADTDRIVVGEREAIIAIAALWQATPVDTLKTWARLRVADAAAPYLPQRFVDADADMLRALTGAASAPTRERRGVTLVDQQLGEMVGREYAARFFDPRRKAAVLEIVANVKDALRKRLQANDWMAPATRATALTKLERITVQAGYPDRWRDYPGLQLTADDLFGNLQRLRASDWAWERSLLAQPVDKRLWALTPQKVNAYNGGQELKIVFPAARLQPPFFGPDADPAANYGAIGAIIGHELSHSFDNRGRLVDANGKIGNWWTEQDIARFEARTGVLRAQYDALEPLPGLHVDGNLTMGENIADLAGLLAALDAYHATLGGKAAPVRDGLSGDQRFFLAYALSRREKQTDDDLRNQLSSDEHAPGRWRVIGAVRNVDAWYTAFPVKPGDRYYVAPDARARIW